MKGKCPSIFLVAILTLSLLTAFSACTFDNLGQRYFNNPTKWERLDFFNEKGIKIHGITSNSEGRLFVFGYDDQEFDCGTLDLGLCCPLKMYQSKDNGATWKESTDELMSFKHSFLKGDKINIGSALNSQLLSQLSKRVAIYAKIGKGVYDYLAYTDFRSKGRYFYDDSNLYAYIDYFLYISTDQGKTWQEMEISRGVLIGEEVTMDIIDGFLVCFDKLSGKKYVYKKSRGRFVPMKNKKFVILRQGLEKRLIFANGKNLASDYFLGTEQSKISRLHKSTPKIDFAEVFVDDRGYHYANTVIPRSGNFADFYPIYSLDQGRRFEGIDFEYYDAIFPDKWPDAMQILAQTESDIFITELYYETTKMSALSVNARYGSSKFALIRNDSIFLFPFYNNSISGSFGNYFVLFHMAEDYVYFSTKRGLYRTSNLALDFPPFNNQIATGKDSIR